MLLACSEVTVSLVLLIGAGLLTRSTWNLYHVPLGYDPAGILSVQIQLPIERYGRIEAAAAATAELRRQVAALPGVKGVAIAVAAPHMVSGCFCELTTEGQQLPDAPAPKFIQRSTVDSTYFSVLRLKTLQGRTFSSRSGEPEVMLSETTARKLWPGGSAVGKRLRLKRGDTLRTVVGVVSDIRAPDGFTADDLIQLYALNPANSPSFTLVVRVNGEASASLTAVSRTVTQFDPTVNVRQLVTAQGMVDTARAQAHFTMIVFAILAAISLLLAAIGLYGVLAYSVEQRRGEIGVRMAMGAPRSAILTSVLRQGAISTITGLVLGVMLAVVASRYMSDMLFEIKPSDPTTYVGIVVLLAGIALLAMLIPARRASRVDPAIVMRGGE